MYATRPLGALHARLGREYDPSIDGPPTWPDTAATLDDFEAQKEAFLRWNVDAGLITEVAPGTYTNVIPFMPGSPTPQAARDLVIAARKVDPNVSRDYLVQQYEKAGLFDQAVQDAMSAKYAYVPPPTPPKSTLTLYEQQGEPQQESAMPLVIGALILAKLLFL